MQSLYLCPFLPSRFLPCPTSIRWIRQTNRNAQTPLTTRRPNGSARRHSPAKKKYCVTKIYIREFLREMTHSQEMTLMEIQQEDKMIIKNIFFLKNINADILREVFAK